MDWTVGFKDNVRYWSSSSGGHCNPPPAVTRMLEGEGIKNDANKARYDLIDWPFVEGMAEVLTLGADKYSDDNWKRVKPFRSRYVGAAMRHFVAWICGERLDKESGLSHLYHLGCCIMFLAWGDKKEK